MSEELACSSSAMASFPNLSRRAEEKLSSANSLKLEGNNFFNNKNLKEAIRHYHKALLYVKGVESDGSDMLSNLSASFAGDKTKENQEKIDPIVLQKNMQLKLDCYNNLSACLLLTPEPDFEKVVFYCQEVIKVTPNNSKAHFRMAQALYKLGNFEKALQSCNQSLNNQLQPDPKVTNLKTSCIAQLAKQTSNEKTMYSKMLGFK